MNVDRIAFPIKSLGPGNPIAIWTAGCKKHCYNCITPELWEPDPMKEISVQSLVHIITTVVSDNGITVDGITITGGDPFEQLEDLLNLLPYVKNMVKDILVYTGYEYSQFKKTLSEWKIECIESNISVLIDGQYVDKLNDNKSALIGSTNQNIIFFDEKLKSKYSEYMEKGRSIENIIHGKKVFSVGIHNREEK